MLLSQSIGESDWWKRDEMQENEDDDDWVS